MLNPHQILFFLLFIEMEGTMRHFGCLVGIPLGYFNVAIVAPL